MSLRYERTEDGLLTKNGRLNARLDAIALIEAELDHRFDELSNLLTEAPEADLIVVSTALVMVAAAALREPEPSPLAALREVRLRLAEQA